MWKRCIFSALRRSSILALLATLNIGVLVGCGGDSDDDTRVGPSDFEITGSWHGVVQQEGLDPFEVTATIRDLEVPAENSVRYTGIDCAGNWTFLGRVESAYRFREVITRGAGRSCKGIGVVELTPFDEDGVDYEFRGGGVKSFGVLKRG